MDTHGLPHASRQNLPAGDSDIMIRCLQGLTQNPNESMHSCMWLLCPKHLKETKRKLKFGAAVAMEYNSGYVTSNLHRCLSLPYTSIPDKDLKGSNNRMDRPLKKKMRNKHLQRDLSYLLGNFCWVEARHHRVSSLNSIFSKLRFFTLHFDHSVSFSQFP